jgi:hypothetical protein
VEPRTSKRLANRQLPKDARHAVVKSRPFSALQLSRLLEPEVEDSFDLDQ